MKYPSQDRDIHTSVKVDKANCDNLDLDLRINSNQSFVFLNIELVSHMQLRFVL